MARAQRTFTPELERDVVALLAREGKTVSEVARNLALPWNLLQRRIEEPPRRGDRGGPPAAARC